MTVTTEDKQAIDATGLDAAKLSGWRAASLDTLPAAEPGAEALSSVTRATFKANNVTTRGGAADLLYPPDGTASPLYRPPFNLTDTQVEDLEGALGRSLEENGLDPDAVFRLPDTPTIVEAEPADPKVMIEYDVETARLVMDMNHQLLSLESEWKVKHERAAIAKKEFEAARDRMLAFIRERQADRGKPTLFDGVPLADADPTQPDPLADLWQSFPLEADRWEPLGLTAKDVEKLNQGETKNHGTHPMATLGDVMRFITPNPSNPSFARTLKDVKGFGDKGFDRWTEAETKFWEWWNNGGGKAEFAAEKGINPDAGQPGTGSGDGPSGGDGNAAAGPAPATDANASAGEGPAAGADAPDAEPKGKGKRKGKAA